MGRAANRSPTDLLVSKGQLVTYWNLGYTRDRFMTKRRRWIAGLAVVTLVLCAGLALASYQSGRMVKAAIEYWGPQVTGSSVKVGTVMLSPWLGQGKLRHLQIGNPAGYAEKNIFSLGSMSFSVDMSSLTSRKVHIRSLVIDSPRVDWEGTFAENNVNRLKRRVDQKSSTLLASAHSTGPSRKVRIDYLLISGGTAHVRYLGLKGDPILLSIPRIELTDLGVDNGGVTVQEVAALVTQKITEGLTQEIRDAIGATLKQRVLLEAGRLIQRFRN
jgi:hypothetical protein